MQEAKSVHRGRIAPTSKARRISDWETKTGARDRREARPYKPQEVFQFDQLMDHPTFRIGLVTEVLSGNKIKVLFEAGEKILIHAR